MQQILLFSNLPCSTIAKIRPHNLKIKDMTNLNGILKLDNREASNLLSPFLNGKSSVTPSTKKFDFQPMNTKPDINCHPTIKIGQI